MFFNSIGKGFSVMFSNWEIWVAILVYVVGFLFYFFLVARIFSKAEEDSAASSAGCLTNAILGPIIQGLLVAFTIAPLIPILLGGDSILPTDFLKDGGWLVIVKSGIAAVVFSIILSFIPIIGNIIANSSGITIFIQAAIVFRITTNQLVSSFADEAIDSSVLFPGALETLGFLLISIVIIYLFTLGILVILSKFINEYTLESFSFIIGNFIGVIPAYLSLTFYSSYVFLSVKEVSQLI